MLEKTLVLVKPDAMQRGLASEVLGRLERRGLKIVAMRLVHIDEALARRHYAEHAGKSFLEGLVSFITSSPVIAVVFEGENAITLVRQTMGVTDPAKSLPGTIRGDLGVNLGRNLIHGSDGPESATREIALFFDEKDILSYERSLDGWIKEG
jgi:nucleoside-diphosphate kinase